MCERLHGHNYRVAVTVYGAVDPATGFVVDFAVLKRVVRGLIEPLDHRVLVPGRNPRLRLHQEPGRLVVDYGERAGWLVLPREHACVVPVSNTTAELLAQWLGEQVGVALAREGAPGITQLVVELEESTGQTASVTVPGEDHRPRVEAQ